MYLDVSQEAGKQFYLSDVQGEIVMLNLLKFNAVADYSNHPGLGPEESISGQRAYKLYMNSALPFIREAGSKVLFYGRAMPFLIGPEAEEWDEMLLVSHVEKKEFLAFAQHPGYLKIKGHRQAALADSRLLPLLPQRIKIE